MKRLPNQFGTTYKLSGSRRRPWIARKLCGKIPDHEKKRMIPQYVTIGYYATRTEALNALAAYNADPQDPSMKRKTIRDVYELWSVEHFPKLRETAHYTAAYSVLLGISDRSMADLKLDDLQFVFRTSGKNRPVLMNVKILLKHLYKYAVIHEIVPQAKLDMIQYLDPGESNPRAITRSIFTPEERKRAFDGVDPIDHVTIFLLCTGLRISEYCDMKVSDGMITIRKAKTAAGVRSIPLPEQLQGVPIERMQVSTMRRQMKAKYNHLPHDTRHTFATLAVECGIDQRIIDAIIGHVSENLTLSTYTHITADAMRDAMDQVVKKVLEIC